MGVSEKLMNRRDFLKGMTGVAGASAAGVLLPDEETTRRFWRGWTPWTPSRARASFETERFDAGMSSFDKWIEALEPRTTPFLSTMQPFDVVKIDDEIMWFDGTKFVRGQAGTQRRHHSAAATIEILGVATPPLSARATSPVRSARARG